MGRICAVVLTFIVALTLAQVPHAQVNFNHALITSGSSGGNLPAGITFTDSGTTNGGTYNFGAASAGRVIVAAFGITGPAGNSISAVNIGGIAATQIVDNTFGGSSSGDHAAIWAAIVPSGTSGTVNATYTGGLTAFGVTVYAITGLSGVSPFGSPLSTSASGGAASGSLGVKSNGVAIGVGLGTRAGGMSYSWSGLSQNTNFSPAAQVQTSAASIGPIGATTLTVTVTPSTLLGSINMLAAASW